MFPIKHFHNLEAQMDPIVFSPILVEAQLERLREFSELNSSKISEDELLHLARTAPPWPFAPGCIRSLRVHTQSGEDHREFAKKRFLENVSMCHRTDFLKVTQSGNFASGDFLDGGGSVPEGRKLGERNIEWIIIHLTSNRPVPTTPRPYGGGERDACGDELLTAAWVAQESFKQVEAIFGNTTWHTCYEFGQDVNYGPIWHYVELHVGDTTASTFLSRKEFANPIIVKEVS